MLNRFWVSNNSDQSDCSIFQDGEFVCSGLTWSQATQFCSGSSLSDIGVSQLSLF